MNRAGLMRARVKIFNPGKRTYFGADPVETMVFDGKAQKKVVSAAQDNEQSGKVGRQSTMFRIRYRAGIGTGCKLVEYIGAESFEYDITGAVNIANKNRTLELSCVYITRRGIDRR